MKKIYLVIIPLIFYFFNACSTKPLEEIKYEKVQKEISYEDDVKPILDNRCVVCHSCYNSPCQLKLSSYEGILRGGAKWTPYETRIEAAPMTRMFVDADGFEQWKEKGFHSVIKNTDSNNDSLMSYFLNQKQLFPEVKGDYAPEYDDLTCAKDKNELEEYFEDKPYHGMPYGFPALTKKEHNILMTWLENGHIGKNVIDKTKNISSFVNVFEEFLNIKDLKHQATSRYIYEHLFLAHIKFPDSNEFYELVRSYTKDGEIDIVKTRLPYDDAKKEVFYRFRKITSTIVHKTHMVYNLDLVKLERFKELFIKTPWANEAYEISYSNKISANPLTAFEQIPAKSRYQFMLDDIHFFIMTFIRGPVCKGQIALNVINDHFWIAFKDPKYDETINDETFFYKNFQNLSLPNEYGGDASLLEAFDFYKYDKDTIAYYKNKNELMKKAYPDGLNLDTLWKGNTPNKDNNDAILSIYRHFDSASVHKGALGNLPKTMWIMDYPLIERLYYSLVSGFDVYGSTPHKILVRKYMDRLRVEGESNFLEYIPRHARKQEFAKWYLSEKARFFTTYTPSNNETNVEFTTNQYVKELMLEILNVTNTKKDPINFIDNYYVENPILDKYNTKEEIETSLKDLTLPKNINIFRDYSSNNFNLSYIRIKMNNGNDLIYSLIINKWHDSVAFMFNEEDRLDPNKDRINFIEGFVGSYPNFFVEIKQDDLSEFFNILINYKNNEDNAKKLSKYYKSRNDEDFWNTYDWFQNKFYELDPVNAGLFDLNRYYKKPIPSIEE